MNEPKREIILLDLSGSMMYASNFGMAISALKLFVESSDAKEFYVYAFGSKKITLLTKEQYRKLTEGDILKVSANLHTIIKNVDVSHGTLIEQDNFISILQTVIPRELVKCARIRIISDFISMKSKVKLRNFFWKQMIWSYNFYNVDNKLARFFWRELKSLQVVTKTISDKPKPKPEFEPTTTK